MKPSDQLSILIVEDNPADSFLIEDMLSSSLLAIEKIHTAGRQDEALRILNETRIDLVLLDLSLPDSFGIASFVHFKELFPKVPVVILTGLSDAQVSLQALQCGAQDYLVKGEFNTSFLVKSIQYSIERKKAEESVLASEEKYRQIFYKNPLPMWITDMETLDILEVNEASIEKYGFTKEEFLSLNLADIQQPCADLSLMSIPENQHRTLWNHVKKNGEIIIIEFASYPINFFGKTAMQIQINDVTEQLRLEKELSLKNQQMIDAVLNAQENERRIIGEELHDNINQILTAIKIGIGFVLDEDTLNRHLLGSCMSNATLAIEEVRKLSKTLIVPSNLRELGLVPSLRILIKDLRVVTGLKIELNIIGFAESFLTEIEKTALYRIVQEQMNNILKYAKASAVVIELRATDANVELSIEDNGKGFDPAVKSHGVGLHNISNRVKQFHGQVSIESSPGEGCRLTVQIVSKNLLSQN